MAMLLMVGSAAATAVTVPSVAPSRISLSRSQLLGDALPLSSASSTVHLSASSTSSAPLVIYCGRGDKRTAKGKRFKHSYGNARPRNKNKGRGPPRLYAPPAARKEPREASDSDEPEYQSEEEVEEGDEFDEVDEE